ncbi:MAG: sigma-70 family RNA polymerase sigma factor [Phycisphaerae bacterium]|jgi:RNA polymerase sigma factor (sigma-70 family)
MRADRQSVNAPRASTAIDAAVAKGDHDAFHQRHARFAPGIRRFFLRRLATNVEMADELSQQTWAELWRVIEDRRFDPQRAAFSTLAYAIAGHVWLRHCRASSGRTESGELPQRPDPLDFAVALQQAELLHALRACVDRQSGPGALEPLERQVVLESAAGRTERELARRLGLSPSSVHARKAAAHKKLRRCLEAKGFGEESVEQISQRLE